MAGVDGQIPLERHGAVQYRLPSASTGFGKRFTRHLAGPFQSHWVKIGAPASVLRGRNQNAQLSEELIAIRRAVADHDVGPIVAVEIPRLDHLTVARQR